MSKFILQRGWAKQNSVGDDARAMLDSSMGPSRDQDPPAGKGGVLEGLLDENVCKRYLAGLCPNDMFKSTKRELKSCSKIHSDRLIEELKAHPDCEKYTAEYESKLLDCLHDICADADRCLAREIGNLKGPRKKLQLTAGWQKTMTNKQDMYKTLIDASKALADEGDVEKSAEKMQQAVVLKKDIDEIRAKFEVETSGKAVCEQCGVRYPLGDTPNDVGNRMSHFSGKTHEAYSMIREKLEQLRQKKKDGAWDKFLNKSKRKSGVGRDDADEDGRDRKRSRSRHREKEGKDKRERSRERRDGSRERRSERRDRRRDRSRSRSRRRR